MDALFVPLANVVGASVDQVKLIACLLVSCPLGSLFIRIPATRPDLKHLFNIFIAIFYFGPVLSLWSAALQLLADMLATYYIAKNVRGHRMPWIVFAIVMGHLMLNHVYRAVYSLSYETFEVTGPQMVLTMKLTTFAWNVWDSERSSEDLDKWQSEKCVREYPSLLAFLGYCFYFPGVLVGPYLEYSAYQSLIDESLFKSAKGKEPENKKRAVPYGRKRVAYRKMVKGLVFLGLYVFFYGTFNYRVVKTAWFPKQSRLYRIGYFQICGFFERTKYYAIWTMTEGAAVLTGLGFTGYSPSGKSLWEGAANVKVRSIEFAPNFKVLLDSWNMKTNVWLRECVYKRVTPKGKKPGFKSSMITFATSALWHGVHPGYYLTFVLGGFIQTAGRLCRANIRPLVLPPLAPSKSKDAQKPSEPEPSLIKRIYDVLGVACSVLLVNYTTAPFMLLTITDSLAAWSILCWYGHWMIFGALAFFYGGGRKLLKAAQEKRVKQVGQAPPEPQLAGEDQARVHYMPPVDDAATEVERRFN